MTPERWEQIEAVFARALELAPEMRAVYLQNACGDDAALRDEVTSLLAEYDREPAFLESPVWLPDPDSAHDAQPERIGAYRIVRVLGRGGMGQVYLAERESVDFRQQVALKVMRRGMDTDDLIARFRTERQILATLSHPNIAHVFDVGATEQDLPYFVMEYVDGVPLLDYCNARQLDTRQRIELFQDICAAVHHAHRSLIVHRDLKPHNILVTHEGVPKLLDFGIAKILDPRAGAPQLTRADVRMLTPHYAAPEQISGAPITTACDVYALGVLLYELLAGRHPFGDAHTPRTEMEQLVLHADPPAPSTRIHDDSASTHSAALPQLRSQLQGDLDTVILKALRKEPEARYASALSLAEDLERHTAGLPVYARPATAGYRLRKFVARNRIAVAAAASLAFVLAAATAITLYQSNRIRQESARVTSERDKAFEVRNFLLEMFGSTGPDQATGDTVTARQLLDRRAATLDGAYPDNPELRAEMMFVLAEGYEKLGLFRAAEPLARQSLAVRRELFGDAHPEVVASRGLVGWLLHQARKLAEAETELRQAVTIGRQVFAGKGDARFARALNDLGVVREAQADYSEAADLYRESLAIRAKIAGPENVGVGVTTSNLSVVFYRRGQVDSAIAMAQQALALFRRVLGEDHQRTSFVQNNLAVFQATKGDHEGAARQHREILERRKRVLGTRHANVAFTMSVLAQELVFIRQFAEAEALLNEAIDIQRGEGTARDVRALTRRRLAELKIVTGRLAEALPHFQAALLELQQVFGDAHEQVAETFRRIADVQEALGHAELAESAHRSAMASVTRALGASSRRTLSIQLAFIDFLRRQNRGAEARSEFASIQGSVSDSVLNANDALGRRLRAVRDSLR